MEEYLIYKAFKKPIYATDGLEYVRTVLTPNGDMPFQGYVKTTLGEAEVLWGSKVLLDVLMGKGEITKKEYEETEIVGNGM